jgi:hypothetical protein
VAHVIESLSELAAAGPPRYRPTGPRDEAMRTARRCYDHLAGRLGVALATSLCERGHLVIPDAGDGAAAVTDAGGRFLEEELGIDIRVPGGRRPLCRTCVDWSERRLHLAGRLGTALCRRSLELGWIEPVRDSRAVMVTRLGRHGFVQKFGIDLS